MEVLALIPARSGSKGLPDKNIKHLNEKPLIAYSIEQALKTKSVNRVIVSTDSEKYLNIAEEYGAEVPFLRPVELAKDDSTDLSVFEHTLKWLKDNEGYVPDIIVHLRPTSPMRKVKDIEKIISILSDDLSIDSVRSIQEMDDTAYKMWFVKENGFLKPVVSSSKKDVYNEPRQGLNKTYKQNACIDAVRAEVILNQSSMTGKKIFGYLMEKTIDIDTIDDFNKAELLIMKNNRNLKNNKTYCFDFDGVIGTLTKDNAYAESKPVISIIDTINKLFMAGNQIIIFTARGYVTGINWEKLTKNQLKKWNVKYHQLIFGKPAADYYIDDKNLMIDDLDYYQNKL